MIAIPAGLRIYLAMGPTDMRKGFDGLSVMAQETLAQDPFSGHLFVFRGKFLEEKTGCSPAAPAAASARRSSTR